jgi:CheY-like chemotaxis protein
MDSTSSAPPASVTIAVVVDPHPDSRSMYQTFLDANGFDTWSVETATAALARLGVAPRPHVVVFDAVLPDMNAPAFCEAMDELLGDGPLVRRVVVTGWLLSMADQKAMLRRGVMAIYQKPCDLDALLRALRS